MLRLGRGRRAPDDEIARARAALAKVRNPESLASLKRRHELGQLLMGARDWPAAEAVYAELAPVSARVAGARNPNTLAAWANLAMSRAELGRADEAAVLLREIVEAYEQTWGDREAGTARSRLQLVQALELGGRYGEALELLDWHLDRCAAEHGPGHPSTVRAQYGKVRLLRSLDRYDEAERLLTDLAQFSTTDQARDLTQAAVLLVRAERGDAIASVSPLRELLARRDTDVIREALATALLGAGEPAEAAALLSRILDGRPETTRGSLILRARLGRAHLEAGALADSERECDAVIAAGAWPAGHPALLGAQTTLARLALARGDRAEGIRELTALVPALTAAHGAHHSRTVEAARWLAEAEGR